jgi:hypothetical protein
MKKNMGNVDRIIRVIMAGIVGILIFTGTISGTFAIITGILATVFVITSFISFCPLYALVGLNTCENK